MRRRSARARSGPSASIRSSASSPARPALPARVWHPSWPSRPAEASSPSPSKTRWSARRRSCFERKCAAYSTCAKASERSLFMNPFKIQEMLGQAKEMQEQMQQKLSQTVIEASSGGGAVTVKMNGKKEVLKISIDPAAVAGLSGSATDLEMLEDLIAAAFNEAGRRAEEILKSSMQGMLGGLNLPPGLF